MIIILRIVAYVFLALCPVSVSYGYDSMGNITSIIRKGLQDGGTPIYHAYLTDHQGNERVVVDENNGKELDRMHGLDWYDHGARHNDAAIG